MFTLGCYEKPSGRFRKDPSERALRFNIGRNERVLEGEEGNGRWRIESRIVNQTDGGAAGAPTVSVYVDHLGGPRRPLPGGGSRQVSQGPVTFVTERGGVRRPSELVKCSSGHAESSISARPRRQRTEVGCICRRGPRSAARPTAASA